MSATLPGPWVTPLLDYLAGLVAVLTVRSAVRAQR